ncbi:type II toxin-antitoxin system HipA family toxin [Thermodesulfobacteriota bacterium]
MSSLAEVKLWGTSIGAVSLEDQNYIATFQYTPEFVGSGIEVAPLTMPLRNEPYQFPALPYGTFHGLPGLLADSLPDRFGNALIDVWLAAQGRTPESFNAVERLCYTGARGMGALEYAPLKGPRNTQSQRLKVEELADLASEVLAGRNNLAVTLEEKAGALNEILRVGTSAGGARAKAVISWNEETNEVRSGQVKAPSGFSYWILKFDGVHGNRDKEIEDPKGYGAIEYAYSIMAKDAGIEMEASHLFEEGGRRHFMTRRFDRTSEGHKKHMLSLCAMAHYDFNNPNAYSYEQAFMVMRRLGLPIEQIEQMFRRMVFNIAARNQDDHVKNIAFLMDRNGNWNLSPAFDMTYSYNPEGLWTSSHQMSMNDKRNNFTLDDFIECGRTISLKQGRAEKILEEVCCVVINWSEYAKAVQIPTGMIEKIKNTHRIMLAS